MCIGIVETLTSPSGNKPIPLGLSSGGLRCCSLKNNGNGTGLFLRNAASAGNMHICSKAWKVQVDHITWFLCNKMKRLYLIS